MLTSPSQWEPLFVSSYNSGAEIVLFQEIMEQSLAVVTISLTYCATNLLLDEEHKLRTTALAVLVLCISVGCQPSKLPPLNKVCNVCSIHVSSKLSFS